MLLMGCLAFKGFIAVAKRSLCFLACVMGKTNVFPFPLDTWPVTLQAVWHTHKCPVCAGEGKAWQWQIKETVPFLRS